MITNIIDFYKDFLETIGLIVDEKGYIYVPSKKRSKLQLTLEGKPVVLPTVENIKTAVDIVDGKPILVKHLFNPMDESAIKGENKSLLRIKDYIERVVTTKIGMVGEVLFNILADTNIEITNMELLELIDRLSEYKAPGVKKLVDEKTVEHWLKLFGDIVRREPHELYTYIVYKKGGKINNEKYNKVGVLTFPFYELISSHNAKKEPLLGIKVRNKDLHAYKVMFESMFHKSSQELIDGIQFGSKNNVSPSFHLLAVIYDFIATSINDFIEIVKTVGVDVDYLEEAKLQRFPFDVNKIEDIIYDLKKELLEIPSENDLMMCNNVSYTNQPSVTKVHDPNQQQSDDVEDAFLQAIKQEQQQYMQPQQAIQQPYPQPVYPQQPPPYDPYQQPVFPFGNTAPGW